MRTAKQILETYKAADMELVELFNNGAAFHLEDRVEFVEKRLLLAASALAMVAEQLIEGNPR